MGDYFYLISMFIVYHIKRYELDMSYDDFKKILNISDDKDEYYKRIKPKWYDNDMVDEYVGVNEQSYNIMKGLIREYPIREAIHFVRSRMGNIDDIIKDDINNFDLYYYGNDYVNKMVLFSKKSIPEYIYNYLIKEKRKYKINKINQKNK